jgi:hypothetical protein
LEASPPLRLLLLELPPSLPDPLELLELVFDPVVAVPAVTTGLLVELVLLPPPSLPEPEVLLLP